MSFLRNQKLNLLFLYQPFLNTSRYAKLTFVAKARDLQGAPAGGALFVFLLKATRIRQIQHAITDAKGEENALV